MASNVRSFFNKAVDDISKASCVMCNKKLSRGGRCSRDFSTANLRTHLLKEHGAQYKSFFKNADKPTTKKRLHNFSVSTIISK